MDEVYERWQKLEKYFWIAGGLTALLSLWYMVRIYTVFQFHKHIYIAPSTHWADSVVISARPASPPVYDPIFDYEHPFFDEPPDQKEQIIDDFFYDNDGFRSDLNEEDDETKFDRAYPPKEIKEQAAKAEQKYLESISEYTPSQIYILYNYFHQKVDRKGFLEILLIWKLSAERPIENSTDFTQQ